MTNVDIERKVITRPKGKPVTWWSRWIRQWDIQLMVVPAMLFIFVFSYLPMYGVLMAFQDYQLFGGFFHSPWVGFKHFEAFFNSPDFWNVMRNTIVISLLKLCIGFPAPILLALMLNEVRLMLFKRIIQTVSYLPHFLSWVIVGGFVGSMLSTDNGSVNMLLMNLHLTSEPISFLSVPEYFWGILVGTGIWKEMGFAAIVYLAAIAGIDPHLYEAASIDGAGRFKQIQLITLPCIRPVIIIFLILAVGNILNAGFEDILILATNPILRDVSDVIDTYVYRMGILNNRFSYAAAAGLFKAVVSIGLLALANKAARKMGSSLW
ncbi:sugar ABC transporter permease [Paenibacillus sonchi]|uniref:Sugar ABC transporter permease n=4 Tax=Paenibacillus TaxID=44249 RepID=A0A974SBT7_9BACL|nr:MULTISPECIES: ABC transporter permease subunit [Paenibacillus sonchi group]KWX70931.1 protein lplB [Paenibacillus riograndensis]MCE3200892.1 ABC transporter permease subunit [Paenibacillus sonchi]QQZ59664.1 sugar ABC transporter permease [Paenibacillus sonchi]